MPEDINRLVSTIKQTKCDMVIISRILGKSEELNLGSIDNILRLVGNKLSAFLINMRWGAQLTDVQNGFRIVDKRSVSALKLSEHSFSIEQETVMKCLKAGKTIIEIPGIERKRLYGISKIHKRKEFWIYLWSLIKNL